MANVPSFKSRAEAFDYMLVHCCEQGVDLLEAAKKAEAFANIVAKNRSLPAVPKTIVSQCMDTLKQVSEIKKEHPDAWNLVSGLVGGVFGVLAGNKATEADEEPLAEPIDFDKID